MTGTSLHEATAPYATASGFSGLCSQSYAAFAFRTIGFSVSDSTPRLRLNNDKIVLQVLVND
jgi:hypothetical protein